MEYGPEWREHRKLAHMVLRAALLCKELLDRPGSFYENVILAVGRVVMSVTYGLSLDAGIQHIKNAEDVMSMLSKVLVPAAHVCDVFPHLKNLPSWFPFQEYASKWRARIERDIIEAPFEHAKQLSVMILSLRPQFISEEDPLREHRIKWVLGSMFTAGAETTHGVLLTFFLAMATHPEKQRVAQEIDNLLRGGDRMPLMSDMSKLPYVNALIKETIRWHPILPLSLARRSAEDDEYHGCLVPKDTTVIPNLW
ncbi:hypothetical protein VNI00_010901 [Paramarasmius palmivorus]|uniref:Cytochrome P450 n=1 Tax=Paramarasmius palmivorus TaxID=297713 RepID=A0AAW0CDH0_9AGAR